MVNQIKRSTCNNLKDLFPRQETKVCKLIRSLYGKKQALKQSHKKFNSVMLANWFKSNKCDNDVYMSKVIRMTMSLCACMLGILIIGSNINIIKAKKTNVGQ